MFNRRKGIFKTNSIIEKVVEETKEPKELLDNSIQLKDLEVGTFLYLIDWDLEPYNKKPSIQRVYIIEKTLGIPINYNGHVLDDKPYYKVYYIEDCKAENILYYKEKHSINTNYDLGKINEYNISEGYKYFFFKDLKIATDCFKSVYELYTDMQIKKQEEQYKEGINKLNEELNKNKAALLDALQKLEV